MTVEGPIQISLVWWDPPRIKVTIDGEEGEFGTKRALKIHIRELESQSNTIELDAELEALLR